MTLTFAEGWACSVSTETHAKHLFDGYNNLTVYMLDFAPITQGETCFTLTAQVR